MKNFMSLFVCLVVFLFLSGCLTSEYKEYRFKINDDGSGEGTIKYVNLMSDEDEGEIVSDTDFDELINNYLNGEQFEIDNPHYNVFEKNLIEENGLLNGEVKFTFSNMDSIGFYVFKDCDCSPIMFFLGTLSELFVESNGEYLEINTDISLITWDQNTTEFYLKTSIQENSSTTHSLLPQYRLWKGDN